MGRRIVVMSATILFVLLAVLFTNIFPNMASATIPNNLWENNAEAPLAPMDPDVWVEVENDDYDLNVEPGSAEPASIKAWVHCDVPPNLAPGEKVVVIVDILGIYAVKDAFIFEFDRTTDVAEMNLQVPPLTGISSEQEYLIRFVPRWSMDVPQRTGGGTSDETLIHPIPYGSVHVKEMDVVRFDVGETVYIEIIVENNGNSEARVSMDIEDEEGMEFIYPDLLFLIPERSFGIYTLGVKQPSGGGKNGDIHVRAKSSVRGLLDSYEMDIEYETRGKVVVFLTNPYISISFLLLIAVFIASVVLLIRRRQKKRELRLS